MPVLRTLRLFAVAVVAMVAVAGGCQRRVAPSRAPAPTMPLVVRNDGVFDVTIYALPSGGTEPRYRLGMVTGASSMTLTIPRHGLQANGSLTLLLHAVGARSSWVSPSIVIPAGGTAYLDIISDPYGDVSRSALYAMGTTAGSDTKR